MSARSGPLNKLKKDVCKTDDSFYATRRVALPDIIILFVKQTKKQVNKNSCATILPSLLLKLPLSLCLCVVLLFWGTSITHLENKMRLREIVTPPRAVSLSPSQPGCTHCALAGAGWVNDVVLRDEVCSCVC